MLSVSRSILIEVPPVRVYAAFTDFASWLDWVPHFREIVLLDDGPLAPGYRARIRETYSPLPAVWRVVEVTPGRSFAWTAALLPGLQLTVAHTAEPEDTGARATLGVEIRGLLGLAIAPLAARLCVRTFDRSLAALKELLERETGG